MMRWLENWEAFCVKYIWKRFGYFLSSSPQSQAPLLRFKWSLLVALLHKLSPLNTYYCCNRAHSRQRQLTLKMFFWGGGSGGWGGEGVNPGGWFSAGQDELGSDRKWAVFWSREAPTGLTWWDPCEVLVWTACLCPCEWFQKGGAIKSNHNTPNRGS